MTEGRPPAKRPPSPSGGEAFVLHGEGLAGPVLVCEVPGPACSRSVVPCAEPLSPAGAVTTFWQPWTSSSVAWQPCSSSWPSGHERQGARPVLV